MLRNILEGSEDVRILTTLTIRIYPLARRPEQFWEKTRQHRDCNPISGSLAFQSPEQTSATGGTPYRG
jgi:hypothetical protein